MEELSLEDKKYFIYEKLLEKCLFTKEEFFSNEENYNLKTLFYCYRNGELDLSYQVEKGNKSAINLISTLDNIRLDLDEGKIIKKDLEKFLNIKKINEKQIEIRYVL